MNKFPKDIEDIIIDYKSSIEHCDRFKKTLDNIKILSSVRYCANCLAITTKDLRFRVVYLINNNKNIPYIICRYYRPHRSYIFEELIIHSINEEFSHIHIS